MIFINHIYFIDYFIDAVRDTKDVNIGQYGQGE